jgi:hypothetical protein
MLAAATGVLAGLTRIQGVFLILPVGWEAFAASWVIAGNPFLGSGATALREQLGRWLRAWPSMWRQAIAPAIAVVAPAVGFVFFMCLAGVMSGQTPLNSQDAWGGTNFHPPWDVVVAAWNWAVDQHDALQLLNLSALILFGVATVVGLFRLPAAYSLYAIPQVLVIATRIQPTPLTSTTRYLLVVFPVFVLLALAGRNRRFERFWLLLSVFLMAYLMSLFLQGDYVA